MTSYDVTPTVRRIQEIVARRLEVRPEQVPVDQSLLDELGLESMDVVDAVLDIEQAFAPATISDAAAVDLATVRQLADHIDAQLRGR